MRVRSTWLFALAIGFAAAANAAPSTFGGCPVFPADNYWNSRIDSAPVHPSSAAWVATIGNTYRLHADFSNDPSDGYGFTPVAVPPSQPLVPITLSDPARSDPGHMPIPPSLATGSGAREVSVTETATCTLYEFFGTPVNGGASWTAGVAAKWDLRSNALRPDGWQSGDQAGLPYLAGLLRWDDVAAGEIGHAIRITARNPSNTYLWPARHAAGVGVADPNRPPMGARFRLKASFDISGFDSRTQIVLRAFRKYGVVLASAGGNWFMQGVSDPGWPQVVIDELQSITGSNFEAVDTAPLMIHVDSGQANQLGEPSPPPAPPSGPPTLPNDNFPPGAMPSGWLQPAGSNAPWVVANDASYAGALSLKSGFIGHGQKSEVAVTRNFAAGSASFARKVSSQAGGDSLQFFIDGVLQGTWSGEQAWSVVSFAIPAGTHTLLWRYSKDASGSAGGDAAWIDSVTLPPLRPCLGRACTAK